MAKDMEAGLNAYREALAEAAGRECSDDMWRVLCRCDLFFLLVFVLNRKDVLKPWIYERCVEVQNNPNGHLDLWAREHYKSTIVTFAKTIQDILIDPEVTIGIFSNTRPLAMQFLRQIKTELQDNGRLKTLFHDILWSDPQRMAPKWSENDGIVCKRRGNPKEATVEAWGLIDGQPTSKHFFGRVYDDTVTQESVGNPEIIEKTTTRWEQSIALGVEGGWERYVGTTYHLHDTYAEMKKRNVVKVREYPATKDGKPDGQPVLMSAKSLMERARKMGIFTFSCQMLLDPQGNKAKTFRREWLQYWTPVRAGLNVYIIVDPASGKRRYKGNKLTNDFTCMWVIGIDANENWMVIDLIRDRLSLSGRTDELFRLHQKYRPIQQVGYEEFGMQADIDHIKEIQETRQYRFPITSLGTNQLSKGDVIESIMPKVQRKELFLPHQLHVINSEGRAEDVIQTFLREEYDMYPVLKHDDGLNGLGLMNDEKIRIVKPADDYTQRVARKMKRDSKRGRTLMSL